MRIRQLEKLRLAAREGKLELRRRHKLAKRPRKGNFVQSVYGPYLRCTPGDRTFELCAIGYGRFISDAIENHDHEFLFMDIGANCGVFSLVASRHPLCRRVIAIEPVPQTFETLETNIAFNRAETIEAVRGVVTDEAVDLLHLTYDPRHSGMSAIVDAGNPRTVTAPVLNAADLSALVGDLGVSVFAKIDVEGSESRVLSVLRDCRFFPAVTDIVIEISERNGGAAGAARTREILEREHFSEISRDGMPEHYDAHYRRI